MKLKKKAILLSVVAVVLFIAAIPVVIMGYFQRKAELRVESNIEATVYVNGKLIGVTPQSYETTERQVVLKLVTNDKNTLYLPYETALSLTPQTKTIVRRNFLAKADSSTTQILSFVKNAGNSAPMTIMTNPQSAYVFVNNEYVGTSPLRIERPASVYSIQLMHTGYQSAHLSLKNSQGYDLTAYTDLPKQINTPVKVVQAPQQNVQVPIVTILTTPSGFVYVHETPSESGHEISRTTAGREYTFEAYSPKLDWIQINLNASQSGWISSKYATVSGYIATPP